MNRVQYSLISSAAVISARVVSAGAESALERLSGPDASGTKLNPTQELMGRYPLGFDMAYRPRERLFAVHWSLRVPALLYVAATLCLVLFVAIGEQMSTSSWWFQFVVVADTHRFMGIRTFAILLLASSLSGLVRSGMRGVRLGPKGLETRDVEMFFVPRVRLYTWPELQRVVLDQPSRIALDLWDGRRAFLPRVNDRAGLASALELVARARAIPVRGGLGIDELVGVDELELEGFSRVG